MAGTTGLAEMFFFALRFFGGKELPFTFHVHTIGLYQQLTFVVLVDACCFPLRVYMDAFVGSLGRRTCIVEDDRIHMLIDLIPDLMPFRPFSASLSDSILIVFLGVDHGIRQGLCFALYRLYVWPRARDHRPPVVRMLATYPASACHELLDPVGGSYVCISLSCRDGV